MTHISESEKKEYDLVKEGTQTFLVLKAQKIKEGDTIILQHSTEVSGENAELHLEELHLKVSFISNGDTQGLKQGYIVAGIKEKE